MAKCFESQRGLRISLKLPPPQGTDSLLPKWNEQQLHAHLLGAPILQHMWACPDLIQFTHHQITFFFQKVLLNFQVAPGADYRPEANVQMSGTQSFRYHESRLNA